MPPMRNKYLFALSTAALLLGVVVLWFGQSSSPASDGSLSNTESESLDVGVASEISLETATTQSPTLDADSEPQSALEQSPDAVAQMPAIIDPGTTATAPVSRNTSAATTPSQTDSTTPRLSQHVFEVISEVQQFQQAGQWEEALNEMNALYRNLDQLNPFEQATLLNFYTNTLARLEMWQESITAFNMILQVPDVRPDVNARALLALGQLHVRVGERLQAIAYLQEWLNYTNGMANMDTLTPRVSNMLTCIQSNAESGTECTL